MEEDEEYLAELYALPRAAESVKSGKDFLEFLKKLQAEVREDDEALERPQIVFFQVVESHINSCIKFPERDHDIVEVPDQPDWNWLARLFLVGAFEN